MVILVNFSDFVVVSCLYLRRKVAQITYNIYNITDYTVNFVQNSEPKDRLLQIMHYAPFHWCIINLLYINITYHNASQVLNGIQVNYTIVR